MAFMAGVGYKGALGITPIRVVEEAGLGRGQARLRCSHRKDLSRPCKGLWSRQGPRLSETCRVEAAAALCTPSPGLLPRKGPSQPPAEASSKLPAAGGRHPSPARGQCGQSPAQKAPRGCAKGPERRGWGRTLRPTKAQGEAAGPPRMAPEGEGPEEGRVPGKPHRAASQGENGKLAHEDRPLGHW